MERAVRNAAKALIIKDDKMLAIKISDGKNEWYIMPGGGRLLRSFYLKRFAEKWQKKQDYR